MKTKRICTIILTIAMIFTITVPGVSAYNYSYDYGYSNSYIGDNYYNTSFSTGYNSKYYMSTWNAELQDAYNPTWYELPQRQVVRGEAFLLWLRTIQHLLDRQRYSRLASGFIKAPFDDYATVNPDAQREVDVLYANDLISGYDDNTMRFNQLLKRCEGAAIFSRFNRKFFNIGTAYTQTNYLGYTAYYNANYNNYYNNYSFSDIQGHWAEQDILMAASTGVMQGVSQNWFDTDGPLTIEQLFAMIDRCAGYRGLKREDIAYAMSQTFKVKMGNVIKETGYQTLDGTKITRLSASTSTLSINQGESKTVKVTIYPSNAQYQKMYWVSSDPRYVSVYEAWNSQNGTANVTLYGMNPINNYITVTGYTMDGSDKSVTLKVKVNAPDNYADSGYVTSINPSESTIYLKPGETTQLNAKVKPSTALNKNIGWSTKNSNIAYVSNVYLSGNYSNATVVAGNIGETDIYLTALDGSGEFEVVHVVVSNNYNQNSYITSVTTNMASVSMNVGQSQTVSFATYPSTAINNTLTWVSDNQNVATVTALNGSIVITTTGVGSTNIRAVAGDGNTVCTIPVISSSSSSITDATKPVVTLEGATQVSMYGNMVLTAKAIDQNLQSFNITVNDIKGLTEALSPVSVDKVSNNEYKVTLMCVTEATGTYGICIGSGVAKDAAGNTNTDSNEIVIFVNSGE